MQFFLYEGMNLETPAKECDRRKDKQLVRAIQKKSDAFHKTLQEDACFFVSEVSDEDITIGAICAEPIPVETRLMEYAKAVGLEITDNPPEEATFGTISGLLRLADRADYIRDDDEILEHFGLDSLRSHYGDCVESAEYLIDERSPEHIYRMAEQHFLSEMLKPELDRIYTGKRVAHHVGHPVHYMIRTDDNDTLRVSFNLLLQALYDRGRLQNKRFSYVDLRPANDISMSFYNCLYRSNEGGAVVVRFRPIADSENDYASSGRNLIERICEIAEKYRQKVLTVFCLPLECKRTKDIFDENLTSISLVELQEENISGARAESFLHGLSRRAGLRSDKKLFANLDWEQVYAITELRERFDRWQSEKLKTVVFPQYRQVETVRKAEAKASPRGSAYDELTEMIGLTEAKQTIKKAIDFHKAQKLFAEQGLQAKHPSMHMIFTGNPGTAKTTVARLFARIMKENGLLSRGQIVEVGRGDLVGKYVGWTAPAIQKKFQQARGGLLFIDEAYSLVDDRDGSFGDEAINTIVQEMENHREDVVVIFAGYPDKMESFLEKNPGLRSRIAFHVKFEDYNADELVRIAELFAKKQSLRLTAEAQSKLHDLFEMASREKDFGNGRYVRNILEQARMAQASRLLAGDVDHLEKEALATIRAEDVIMPQVLKKQKSHIGFC